MTDDKASNPGCVYLIGAGPGDPGLMTCRGMDRLHQSDAVVYDSLIADELVIALPRSVERHFVGKRAGHHSLTQDEINELLLRLAREGKRVARLKGGDPMLFGRGSEEAQFLLHKETCSASGEVLRDASG